MIRSNPKINARISKISRIWNAAQFISKYMMDRFIIGRKKLKSRFMPKIIIIAAK
jgi:hypothetical protein